MRCDVEEKLKTRTRMGMISFDVMDIALDGKIAIIEAVEEDVDKNVHFVVVFEDDPERDIGMMPYIAHRFFYSADEVEAI